MIHMIGRGRSVIERTPARQPQKNREGDVRLSASERQPTRFRFRGADYVRSPVPVNRSSLLVRSLRRDLRRGFRGGVRVAKVVVPDRREIIVQLVDQRKARRDV